MLVPAKLQMNWASASGISTCRNPADGRPALPAAATSHLLHTNRDDTLAPATPSSQMGVAGA
jgi:hypothetical protein